MIKKNDLEKTLELYGDIIDLPHHQSSTRPHMSLHDRAAQFAPFAALTGYDEMISEEARLTDAMQEPDDIMKDILNSRLAELSYRLSSSLSSEIRITYFCPDEKKSGGSYKEYTGCVRVIDGINRLLIFEDETVIEIEKLANLEFSR